MEFAEMQARARAVRFRYAEAESARFGRSWTHEELMLGFRLTTLTRAAE